MRISKQNHLKRLLQTQDVLIGTLAYTTSQVLMWLTGFADLPGTSYHLQLTPFVILFSVTASIRHIPALYHQSILNIAVFAVRYATIVVIGMLAVAYFAKFDEVSRYGLALTGSLIAVGLVVNRVFLGWWYFRIRTEDSDNYLKVLVIGSGNRARHLMKTYKEKSEWGIDFVGVLDPDAKRTGTEVDGVPVLGQPDKIEDLISSQVIDEVVVCLPRSLIDDVAAVFDACAEQGVSIKFMADFYDMPESTVSLETVGDTPILNFDPVHHEEGKLIVKRIMDLLLTIPVMAFLIPFFMLVGLAIKLESRGPVFFKQGRIGLNKRIFSMIKFRSMYQDAEQRMAGIEHLNEAEGPIFKIKNDPRITRIGRIIRRTSVDELPQLLNVLLGHMSLIGPRAMSVRDVEQFSLGVQRKRFSVRPGLACLREVSGRSRLSFDQWLALDLKYIDEWSLWLDFKILFKVPVAVIRGDGAS
ncbi:MAG: sugar transferase [Gammaproteobacteria bacterium]|nr:sugar transferase [Gammaproteobacteria bacterium]